jgi:hypothetical protein
LSVLVVPEYRAPLTIATRQKRLTPRPPGGNLPAHASDQALAGFPEPGRFGTEASFRAAPCMKEPSSRFLPGRAGLVAVVVLYLGLGTLWAALVPPFEKPDEIAHFAYVQFMAKEWRIPRQARETYPFLEPETQQPPLYYALAAVAYRASTVAGLPATNLHSWHDRINRHHGEPPPLGGLNAYHHSERFLDPPDAFPYDLILIRLFSLGLGALTLAGTYKIARRLFPDGVGLPVFTTAAVATLPQFTFISTSVSNDVMGFALGAILLYRMVTVDEEHLSRDYSVLGVLLGLAVLVKFTLLPLLPLAFLPMLRGGPTARDRISAFGLFAVGFATVGGWWFVRNGALYGDMLGRQEIINPAEYAWNIDRKTLFSPYFRDFFWTMTGKSFVGKFGFMRIDMPKTYYAAWSGLLLGSATGMALRLARDVSRHRRRLRELAAAPTAILSAAVLMALAALIHYNLQVSQPQGRYLFHVLPAIACLFVMGCRELAMPIVRHPRISLVSTRAGTAAVVAAIGALVGINLLALFRVVLPVY